MAAPKRPGLETADPRVGQTLSFEGHEWEVTDHSSYWSPEGYRVTEWCCETGDTEAYLLKEVQEGVPTRWFFTRHISSDAVAVAGGEALPAWVASHRDAAPPETVTYAGGTYRHVDTTEGTYEDEPGQRVPKTTWDYWDEGRATNLAVERWGDGRVDCYHGSYIEPGQVTLDPAASGDAGVASASATPFVASGLRADARPAATRQTPALRRRLNPFLAAAVCLPIVYVLPFFLGRPFDQSISASLPLALLGGWVFALARAPAAAATGLLLAALLTVVFWWYPPQTRAVGFLALLVAPAVVLWGGGRREAAEGHLPVLYAAFVAVAAPLLVLGLFHYFRFAPMPHSLGQLALALGPAALGGALGCAALAVLLTFSDTESP